jgi:hypothetical protein
MRKSRKQKKQKKKEVKHDKKKAKNRVPFVVSPPAYKLLLLLRLQWQCSALEAAGAVQRQVPRRQQ